MCSAHSHERASQVQPVPADTHPMNRRLQPEGGFSLVELMTIVLIIGVLIAISVPTFLGSRSRSEDRVAQQKVRLAYATEKLEFVERNAYTEDLSALHGREPALTMQAGGTPATTTPVYVQVQGSNGELFLSSKSTSGTCFYMAHVPSPNATENTRYARDSACGSATSQTYTGSW